MTLPNELYGIEEDTAIVGDIDAWMAKYESGYFAEAWENLRANSLKYLDQDYPLPAIN